MDQIEPVAWIRIVQIVGPRLDRDHQTVDGVIDERYKDSAGFHEQDVRDRLQVLNGGIEFGCAVERLRIRVEMFE